MPSSQPNNNNSSEDSVFDSSSNKSDVEKGVDADF